MFHLKQVFIVWLRFSESVKRDQAKCLVLNDEPCMVRLTLTDLNPVELKYYHSWLVYINVLNVVMSDLQKYGFQKKQKT